MLKILWLLLYFFGVPFAFTAALNCLRSALDLKEISYLDFFYRIRDIFLFREHETVYKKNGGESDE